MIDRHSSIEPVHPGEVLHEDVLPALSMSKTAVADALGISRQTLYDILNKKQPVSAEMAVRFGKLLQCNTDKALVKNSELSPTRFRSALPILETLSDIGH